MADQIQQVPLDAQLPGETIGVTPVHDRRYDEADDCDRAEDRITESARKREIENDNDGAEQEAMAGEPRVHLVPHCVVSKCGGDAKSIESIARNPSKEQWNRDENQHGTDRAHRASLQLRVQFEWCRYDSAGCCQGA